MLPFTPKQIKPAPVDPFQFDNDFEDDADGKIEGLSCKDDEEVNCAGIPNMCLASFCNSDATCEVNTCKQALFDGNVIPIEPCSAVWTDRVTGDLIEKCVNLGEQGRGTLFELTYCLDRFKLCKLALQGNYDQPNMECICL